MRTKQMKSRYGLSLFVLAMTFLLAPQQSQAQREIVIGYHPTSGSGTPVLGSPGSTVLIELRYEDPLEVNPPVSGIQVDIATDNPNLIVHLFDIPTSPFLPDPALLGLGLLMQASAIPGGGPLGEDIVRLIVSPDPAFPGPIPIIPHSSNLGTLTYLISPIASPAGTINLLGVGGDFSDEFGNSIGPPVFFDGIVIVSGVNDLNNDGQVSVSDVIRLVRIVLGLDPDPGPFADINGSGGPADVTDVVALVNEILGINGGGTVLKPDLAGPVAVRLGDAQAMGGGQYAIPVIFDANGTIAGAQTTFTFDPAILQVGTPQLVGPAAGMEIESHISDGTLRLIAYGLTAGQQISSGSGTMLLIPVTVIGNAQVNPMLTLSHVVLAGPQAQRIEVRLGQTTITVPKSGAPGSFALKGNSPNPFNPSTSIAYEVPQQGHITLTVYNLVGQEIIHLVDTMKTPGRYTVVWNGRNAQGIGVASGVYLYRLSSDTGHNDTKRMTLLK